MKKNAIYFRGKKIKSKDVLTSRGMRERIVFIIAFILFAAYAISLITPILYLFINSFQSKLEYYNNLGEKGNAFSLPTVWKWQNYITALNGMYATDSFGKKIMLHEMFFNSMWYVAGSVSLGILGCCFTGYALAKYDFVGKKVIYGIIIFTMTIPIIGSTGASFKLMTELGIYNTPFMLVTAFGGFGFNFLILYGFFKNLSWSYAEAVFIDGGGHFTVLFKVMLPMTKAPVFTLAVMATISAWNDYNTALLYMPDYPTVASGLYRIKQTFTDDTPAYFAGLMMSMIPVIILFSCCSGTIMKNFTMGGLKG